LAIVEVVVVDASVQDVHAPLAARSAHVEHVVAAEQVAPLHEFDAHLPG